MKRIEVLNTGRQNEALTGVSDFFLSDSEKSKLLGGNNDAAQSCEKGYKEKTWFGGGVRCGYTA